MHSSRPSIEFQGLIKAAGRLAAHLKLLLLIGFILIVALNSLNLIYAFDYPWQWNEGEFLLAHGHPAVSTLNNYGEISPHFTNEYILYEVFIAVLNHATGWIGVCLFFGLLGIAIYLPVVLALIRSENGFFLPRFILLTLVYFVIYPRITARPEMIGDICYLATGILLLRQQDRPWKMASILALGFIFFIWANVHSSFLIGLVLLSLWYGQKIIFEGRTIIVSRNFAFFWPGVAAACGCILNPSGPARIWQPFQLHSLIWGQGTSFEMWPVALDSAKLLLAVTGLAFLVLLPRMRKKKLYWLGALLLALLYLTFTSNRYGIFVGLTCLLVLWVSVEDGECSRPIHAGLDLLDATACFPLVLCAIFGVVCVFYADVIGIGKRDRYCFPGTLVATNPSFAWLYAKSPNKYAVLSSVNWGSWCQLPGQTNIHALMDSGTHRYSDETNQLYYYSLFSRESAELILSKLDTNCVVLSNVNMQWADILNHNPQWRLVQIGNDSQVYLRQSKPDDDYSNEHAVFERWEKEQELHNGDAATMANSQNFLRGLKLKSDRESLDLLLNMSDVSWMLDPEINYLSDWLATVPDELVLGALNSLGAGMRNSEIGLRILFLLRLKHYDQAAGLAFLWKPSIWSRNYQAMQELRVQALEVNGNRAAAKEILESLWPKPRYSLRWAFLCREVYTDRPSDMPREAQLLLSLVNKDGWQETLIAKLNQNIRQQITAP